MMIEWWIMKMISYGVSMEDSIGLEFVIDYKYEDIEYKYFIRKNDIIYTKIKKDNEIVL